MPSPPRGRIMPGPTCCPTIKSLRAPWRFFEADVAWSGSGHLRGMQRSPSGVLVGVTGSSPALRNVRMAARGWNRVQAITEFYRRVVCVWS
jgi:hypothetical protein